MKKLKIVYLDFDDIRNPLLGGGQAIATKLVGSRLAKKGHKVISICSRYPGYKDRVENDIEYKHIGIGTRFIRLNNIFYILLIPLAVLRLKADIIIECFTPPASTLFSPLFTKIPVVGLPSQFQAKEFSRKYHLPFEHIERFGCKFYKYFLPYTKDVDMRMRKYNPSVISKIVPHGAEDDYFRINKITPKYILFLGRMDMDQKGIDLLLKAYASVKETIPYPLVIAGHGVDENKVKELAVNLGLRDKVKFIGGAYGAKKLKVLAEALFVAFSSRHDDLPIFSIEALAAGLPLVCFDIPEMKWASHDIAWKSKPYDVLGYGKLLLKAATDNKTFEMRKNARKFARRFSWEKVTLEFESFFYEILSKKT